MENSCVDCTHPGILGSRRNKTHRSWTSLLLTMRFSFLLEALDFLLIPPLEFLAAIGLGISDTKVQIRPCLIFGETYALLGHVKDQFSESVLYARQRRFYLFYYDMQLLYVKFLMPVNLECLVLECKRCPGFSLKYFANMCSVFKCS